MPAPAGEARFSADDDGATEVWAVETLPVSSLVTDTDDAALFPAKPAGPPDEEAPPITPLLQTVFPAASFSRIFRSAFRNSATARSLTTTFQCSAIICALAPPSFSMGGNATSWLLRKRVWLRSTRLCMSSSNESKTKSLVSTLRSSPAPSVMSSRSAGAAYRLAHRMRLSSARQRSAVVRQSFMLSMPTTAEVHR